MMPSFNKLIAIGHLGRDPEMRFTASGAPVTSFSLATSYSYKTGEGETKQETEWFDVVTWNRLAETCNQFLGKGRRAYVEGRLRTRSWEGQDGQRHFRVEIVANSVLFLDKRPSGALPEAGAEVGTEDDLDPADIPF